MMHIVRLQCGRFLVLDCEVRNTQASSHAPPCKENNIYNDTNTFNSFRRFIYSVPSEPFIIHIHSTLR